MCFFAGSNVAPLKLVRTAVDTIYGVWDEQTLFQRPEFCALLLSDSPVLQETHGTSFSLVVA